MSKKNYNLIVVFGATASGKTRLGVELAKHVNGEIISADSRQVYKGLDIGSGKDLDEYGNVPYHLIDIIEPGLEYSVFQFQHDFVSCFNDIQHRGKMPLLVGGTGLYIDAVVSGYEFVQVEKDWDLREQLTQLPLEQVQAMLKELSQEQFDSIDIAVRPRLYRAIEIARSKNSAVQPKLNLPQITPLYFAIKWDRKVLRKRITTRLEQRFESGMVEEVQGLLDRGVSHEKLERFGLEYRLVSQFIEGKLSYDEMFNKLNTSIHQYAKRQDTWFRKIERRGDKVYWLEGMKDCYQQAMEVLDKLNKT